MNGPLFLSLKVSLAATVLAVLIGTIIAYFLAKRKFPGKAVAQGLSVMPMVLPPTVLGYALLVAMGRDSAVGRGYRSITGVDLVFTFNGIVTAACLASVPFFIWQAQVAFSEVERDLEDSARLEGAGEWTVFGRITAPLSIRGLVAGTVLTFARALGDFGATLMVGGAIPGRTQTLPLAVYDAWQANENQLAQSLSLLLAAVALVVAVSAARLTQRDA
jgi:molybdate transport system permease protein